MWTNFYTNSNIEFSKINELKKSIESKLSHHLKSTFAKIECSSAQLFIHIS